MTNPSPLFDQIAPPDDLTQDQLGIRNEGTGAGQIGVSGSDVTFGGVVIGTIISDGTDGSELIVTFNANATVEAVEALIENLTYQNISDDPLATRQFRVQVSDGDGGTSAPQFVTVSITAEVDGAVPVFGEARVNSFTEGAQDEPAISGLSGGGYVVVWTSANQDGSGDGVFAQRYDANGNVVGPEFQVNTTALSSQSDPSVAALSGGGFVVAWTDNGSLDGSGNGVFAQRFDAAGAAVGGEFQVNTENFSTQSDPSVAGLSGGGFVVAWTSFGQDGSSNGVFAQRFDATGAAVGGEFQVNTEFSSTQFEPSVAGLSGGGFVVVWTSVTSGTAGDGSSNGVFAQLYDASGAAVGGEFLINKETFSAQF